eukprot:3318492-Pleurochrysis_carterae.AAC.1
MQPPMACCPVPRNVSPGVACMVLTFVNPCIPSSRTSGDLHSGRDEARSMRKQLIQQAIRPSLCASTTALRGAGRVVRGLERHGTQRARKAFIRQAARLHVLSIRMRPHAFACPVAHSWRFITRALFRAPCCQEPLPECRVFSVSSDEDFAPSAYPVLKASALCFAACARLHCMAAPRRRRRPSSRGWKRK